MTFLPSKHSLALFTVSAASGGVDGKTPPSRLCHEVRQVVQQCTLPDLDVLLPHNSSKPLKGRCFIVAVADKLDAEVLARRLREQLQRWEQGQQTGITFSVAYQFVDLPPQGPDGYGKDLLQVISTRVEQLVKKEGLMKCHAGGEQSRA